MLYLLDQYDPKLKTKCEDFDFENPQMDPGALVAQLKETMIEKKGIGIAAPQCGYMYRVMLVGHYLDPDGIAAVFNPRIVFESEDIVEYEEGCLTFPGLFIKIKRPREIRARYADFKNEVKTERLTGLTARVFLHEFDHLEGKLFTSRASKVRLDQARRMKTKLDKRRKIIAEREKNA